MRSPLRLSLVLPLLLACVEENPLAEEETETSGISGDGDPTGDGDGDGDGETTGDGDGDGESGCQVTTCQGKVYQCGNCLDDDSDGHIDASDADCWGPCHNNEDGFKGEIPGQAHAPCTSLDCYFDGDSGTGNDSCNWTHTCDPSEPNPSHCTYDPETGLPGSGGLTCEEAMAMQSEICDQVCSPLTPNGCDCFGCCQVGQGDQIYTVYLGTEDSNGNGTCTLENIADPELCAPCVQVEGCFNPCDHGICEICIGETVVPEDCDEAGCPDGIQSCDPELNSSDCPVGMVCVTGCCYPTPE
jgi:hypothetical protein